MDSALAVDRIKCILSRLEQGPVTDTELDQLLKEATCTADKTEQDYLYTVISSLHPHIVLPKNHINASSGPCKSLQNQHGPKRLPFSDATNRQQQAQPAATPTCSSDQADGLQHAQHLQQLHFAVPGITADSIADAALPARDVAAGSTHLTATTDQLAALVTAATTAATKAVARTILHHTRTARSEQPERANNDFLNVSHSAGRAVHESDGQQQQRQDRQDQQLTVSSRLQHQTVPLSAQQQLLRYAAQQQQFGRQEQPPASSAGAAGTSIGTIAGRVVACPRIWVRPCEQEQHQQGLQLEGVPQKQLQRNEQLPLQEQVAQQQQQLAQQRGQDEAIRLRPSRLQQGNRSVTAATSSAGDSTVTVAGGKALAARDGAESHTSVSGVRSGKNGSHQQLLVSDDRVRAAATAAAAEGNAGPASMSSAAVLVQEKPHSSADGQQNSANCQSNPKAISSAEVEAAVLPAAAEQVVPQNSSNLMKDANMGGVEVQPAAGATTTPGQTAEQRQEQKQQLPKFQGTAGQQLQGRLLCKDKKKQRRQSAEETAAVQQPVKQQQPEPVLPLPVPLPAELHSAVEKTLQHLQEPPKPYPAAVITGNAWQQQPPEVDEATRAAHRLLGGTFDYRKAAQQLSEVSKAVQTLTAAHKSSSGTHHSSYSAKPPALAGSSSQTISTAAAAAESAPPPAVPAVVNSAVRDAAAAVDDTAAWPAVLGDVMSPLARFYDQEDAWQDLHSFSKAVEREVSWRLVAAAADPASNSSSSRTAGNGKSVSWATLKKAASQSAAAPTPAKPAGGVATPTKTPVKGADASEISAAAVTVPHNSAATGSKRAPATAAVATAAAGSASKTARSPVKAATKEPDPGQTSAAAVAGKTTASPGVRAAAEPQVTKPVVAFGRRVDKPLPAPSLSSKQLTVYSNSSSKVATAATTAAQGLQPARQLPCFIEHGAGVTSAGKSSSSYRRAAAANAASRATATAAALQRLSKRRRAAAAGAGSRMAAATIVQGFNKLGGLECDALDAADPAAAGDIDDGDVLDTLLDALLAAQQQQEHQVQNQQYELQQNEDQPHCYHQQHYNSVVQQDQDEAVVGVQQRGGFAAAAAAVAAAAPTRGKTQQRTVLPGRQFEALYDISQPYIPVAAASTATEAAMKMAPHAQAVASPPQHTHGLLQQTQQRHAVSTSADASTYCYSTIMPAAAAASASRVAAAPAAASAAAGRDPESEMVDLLVDTVMGQLLAQKAAAAAAVDHAPTVLMQDAKSAPANTSSEPATAGLPAPLLRELVTEEIAAAINQWMAEEADAVKAPAVQQPAATAVQQQQQQQCRQHQLASNSFEDLQEAATHHSSASGKNAAAAAAQSSSSAPNSTALIDDEALLHALTEALASTCGAFVGHQSAVTTVQAPAGLAAARIDATAQQVGHSDSTPAPTTAVASKGSAGKTRQLKAFGQLPGLKATSAAGAVMNGNSSAVQQQQQPAQALSPAAGSVQTGQPSMGTVAAEQIPQSCQQLQQEEQLAQLAAARASTGAAAPAVSLMLGADASTNQPEQQQETYELLPALQHAQQVEQLDQLEQQCGQHQAAMAAAAAAQPNFMADGSRASSPAPNYGMTAMDRDASVDAFIALGTNMPPGCFRRQQLQGAMLPMKHSAQLDAAVAATAAAVQGPDGQSRISLPGSDCFRDSLDTSSSSSSVQQTAAAAAGKNAGHSQPHAHVIDVASFRNPAVNTAPWLQHPAPVACSGPAAAQGATAQYAPDILAAGAAAASHLQTSVSSSSHSYADDFEPAEEQYPQQQQGQVQFNAPSEQPQAQQAQAQVDAASEQTQQQQQQQRLECGVQQWTAPAATGVSASRAHSSSSHSRSTDSSSSASEVPSDELHGIAAAATSQPIHANTPTAAADASEPYTCLKSAVFEVLGATSPGPTNSAAAANAVVADGSTHSAQSQAVKDPLQLPELETFSSSSGGSSSRHSKPGQQQQQQQEAAFVTGGCLWRPTVTAGAQLTLQQRAEQLLRLPLRSTVAPHMQQQQQQQPFPSPGFSSVLGVDSSSTTLTTIGGSSSGGGLTRSSALSDITDTSSSTSSSSSLSSLESVLQDFRKLLARGTSAATTAAAAAGASNFDEQHLRTATAAMAQAVGGSQRSSMAATGMAAAAASSIRRHKLYQLVKQQQQRQQQQQQQQCIRTHRHNTPGSGSDPATAVEQHSWQQLDNSNAGIVSTDMPMGHLHSVSAAAGAAAQGSAGLRTVGLLRFNASNTLSSGVVGAAAHAATTAAATTADSHAYANCRTLHMQQQAQRLVCQDYAEVGRACAAEDDEVSLTTSGSSSSSSNAGRLLYLGGCADMLASSSSLSLLHSVTSSLASS